MKEIYIFLLLVLLVSGKTNIFVGGLFNFEESDVFSSYYSFLYAIEEINADEILLMNYSLVPVVESDFCEVFLGADQVEFLFSEANSSLAVMIGPQCLESVGLMESMRTINPVPVMMSPVLGNALLSDDEQYQYFTRVTPLYSGVTSAWVALTKFYGVKNVGIIYSTNAVYSDIALSFTQSAQAEGITVTGEIFVETSDNTTLDTAIQRLKRSGSTFFFYACSDLFRPQVFEMASNYNIIGFGFIWIGENFLHSDLDIIPEYEGSMFLSAKLDSTKSQELYSSLQLSYPNILNQKDIYYTYDAVHVVADALHELLEVDGADMNNFETFRAQLYDKIILSESTGISGDLNFKENGDRSGIIYNIYNIQGSSNTNYSIMKVGEISSQNIVSITENIQWPGLFVNSGDYLPPTVINFIVDIPTNWLSIMQPPVNLMIDGLNNSTDILPDYYLNYIWLDSGCSGLTGMSEFMRIITEFGGAISFLIGGSCSVVSQPLGQVTTVWNMPMISYASTSPSLSDKGQYPLFRRTLAPDTFQGRAWYTIVKHFGWTRVATVNSNEDLHSLLVKEFSVRAEDDSDIEILTQEVFPGGTSFDITSQLNNIQSKGARIILLACYSDDAAIILEAAKSLEMTGENGYIWIGTDAWFDSTFIDRAKDDFQGLIGTNPALGRGEMSTLFWDNLYATGYTKPRIVYVEAMADSILTAAYALDEILGWGNVSYDTSNAFRSLLFHQIGLSDFEGVNGRITFDEFGDRSTEYDLLNLVGEELVSVGIVNSLEFTFEETDTVISWATGEDTIPLDKPQPVTIPVSPVVVTISFVVSIVGLVIVLLFTISLIYYRKHKVFQAARVVFCGIILVCGAAIYTSVILGYFVSDLTCGLNLWMVHLPLVVTLSCILSKAWRVYVVFVKNIKKMRAIKIKDQRLLTWITAFAVATGLYLLVGTILNPYVSTAVVNDLNPDEQFVFCKIRDDNILQYWTVILYLGEAVLIVTGAVLSYLTRKVELLHYNESSFIAICIYNILFTGAVLLPLTYLISEQDQDSQSAIRTTGLTLNITVLLCFFFISRLFYIRKGIIESDESTNTRGGGKAKIVNIQPKKK